MKKIKDSILLTENELQEIISNAVNIALKAPKQEERLEIEQVGDYYSQLVVMKLLNRKPTWFHNKRKSGELPAIKSGNQWWYKKTDIEDFVKNGQRLNC